MDILAIVLSSLLGYLLGSINFAIIISKVFKNEDIRDYGSGNAGMTNMLRTYGKKYAILTLAGDMLKGILGAYIGGVICNFLNVSFYIKIGLYIGGIAAILGHIYPIYFKFRGGKAIATGAGVVCVINPPVLLILFLIFIIVVFFTKYISAGSIAAAATFPILIGISAYINKTPILIEVLLAIVMGSIVIFMHRSNIKRLIKGEENKLTFKKSR